jgi:cyclophilin family peptidyl-prolyl cis-trans isomerase
VANFIHLVEKGFFKGLSFHRVLPQFVIQGGALKDDGTGGPGYTIPCECFEKKDGKPVFRRHFRGSLSMAHAGRDTGNSQFFICLTAADNVRNLDAKFTPDDKPDGGHTVFGRVVSGFDVLGKITRRDPQRPEQEHVRLDRIEDAQVIRKRNHTYVPKKVGDEEAKAKTDEKAKTGEKTKTDEAGKADPKGKTKVKKGS